MNEPSSTAEQMVSERAPGSIMFSFLQVAHALEARLEEALARVGLSSPKLTVLSKLAGAGAPLTLSELASRVCCVRSNMTQLVDRLEAEGLVRRVDDPDDRRVVRAHLTPLGEARQAEGAQQLKRIQREFASALADDDRESLERLLVRLSE
jgi:DNA-binding MarR family transcriptional regulator